MRSCLFILSAVLILLTLGTDLFSSPGGALVNDPSHWVCVVNDDDGQSESKHGALREPSFTLLDDLSATGQHLVVGLPQNGLVLSLPDSDVAKLSPGVRLHRWVCRESC